MPELPDVTLYVEALRPRVVGHRLERVSVRSPFLLRSFEPPVDSLEGRRVEAVERLAKRIVLAFEGDFFAVIHLMIAGRLRWAEAPSARPGKIELARFVFGSGVITLTEAAKQHRASLHLEDHREALESHDAGGLDVFESDDAPLIERLRSENRALKRALTDPRIFSGIGNAYSDEILHAARLSPVALTKSLKDEEAARLVEASRRVLREWTDRLREEFGVVRGAPGRFPGAGDITAFRPGFAAHGRFGEPCPDCATPIQRIVRGENECNYCPRCQTGGKVLADRSLSRLLKGDWPRTVEELDEPGPATR